MSETFKIKDSGERTAFESGMVRDTDEGKTLWHLVASGPMLKRWAEHLTAGAKKYSADNWMKADGEAELARFKASAFRHFMQWFLGHRDEDHGAAVFFNINGAEYLREKFNGRIYTSKQIAGAISALERFGSAGGDIGKSVQASSGIQEISESDKAASGSPES